MADNFEAVPATEAAAVRQAGARDLEGLQIIGEGDQVAQGKIADVDTASVDLHAGQSSGTNGVLKRGRGLDGGDLKGGRSLGG